MRDPNDKLSNFMGDPAADSNAERSLADQLKELQFSIGLSLFRQHEAARRKNMLLDFERRRYATLFNLAPVSYVALDEDLYIREANMAAGMLFLMPSRRMLGENISRFLSPSNLEIFRAYRENARLSQKFGFELEMRKAVNRTFCARLEGVLTRELKLFISIIDITDLKKAHQELTDARDHLQITIGQLREEMAMRERAEQELRRFAQKLMEVQENERQKIAQELHDQVGQLMTYLGLLLDKAKPQLGPSLYRDAKSVAGEILTQIRDLSSELQPSMLRSVGLVPALLALIRRFEEVTSIRIQASIDSGCEKISGDLSIVAYRIVQEALTNVARHAYVSSARVALKLDDWFLILRVEDEGKGFELGSDYGCTGLTGMSERAQSIGGSITIDSSPGHGTTVLARLPIRGQQEQTSIHKSAS